MRIYRKIIAFGLHLSLYVFGACEQRLEQSARTSPEICGQYGDEDKRNWCLGRCDQVKNSSYQKICRSNHAKNKE